MKIKIILSTVILLLTSKIALSFAGDKPIVTITATKPRASYTCDEKGIFTISLSEGANSDLTINFSVSGSAIEGTDFDTIVRGITFSKGNSSKEIKNTPDNS